MEKPHRQTSADRSQELVAHAIDIVRETGLSSLTMKKVADRVGFTETAAYRYFPNKQTLLLAVAEELGEQLLDPVRSIAQSNASPGNRLTRILRHHIDFVLRLDGLPILILAEAAATGQRTLVARFGAIVTEYTKHVSSVIAQMPASRGTATAEELALLVLGVPAGLAIRRRVGTSHPSETRVREQLVPFIVSCLSRTPMGGKP